MSPELQKALNEVTVALSPMPEGYYVDVDEKVGAILVCSVRPEPEGLGFAITKDQITDGLHIDRALDTFQDLMKAVDEGMAKQAEAINDRGIANAPSSDQVH